MTCPNCGLENQQGAYCKNCGQFLDKSNSDSTSANPLPESPASVPTEPALGEKINKGLKLEPAQDSIESETSPADSSTPSITPAPASAKTPTSTISNPANKEFLTVWLLSVLVGFIGVDRFYLGKVGTGILKLLTWGGYGIWTLIDIIFVLTNQTKDKQGNPLTSTPQQRKLAAWLTIPLIFVELFVFLILMGMSATLGTN